MKCEYCGHKINVTERYCSNCGAENSYYQFDYEKKEDERIQDKQAQNAKKILILCIILFLGFAIITVLPFIIVPIIIMHMEKALGIIGLTLMI